MNSKEATSWKTYIAGAAPGGAAGSVGANLRAALSLGPVLGPAKQTNYTLIKAAMTTAKIFAPSAMSITEAGVLLGKQVVPNVVVQVEKPSDFDPVKALSELTAEAGHHATINGVEVYLDKDQAAHQPTSEPIGSRQTSGKDKFKSNIASIGWHERLTMLAMATWAAGIPAETLANGFKEYFGQKNDAEGISYEAYCQLLDGTRYVSFHCYPARGNGGDRYRA